MARPGLQRVEELFHQAVALRPQDRASYLDEVCAGNPDLRAAVDDLLRHDSAGTATASFLASPIGRDIEDCRQDAPTQPAPADGTLDPALPCLPGYELLEELGRGGMGVVYKARQQSLNRLVALKMLLFQTGTPEQLARFRAEAQSLARLHHPNIVPIFDIGECQGRPYFCMEYVSGPNLAQWLDGRPLDPRAAAGLIELLARAIHCVHECGIVHRDLKPANILLQGEGKKEKTEGQSASLLSIPCSLLPVPKITDFGLAKDQAADRRLTLSGTAMGTPYYMAPEQARGRAGAVGPAADVYSLGSILYEMLTGRPPFDAVTPAAAIAQLLNDEPLSPTRLRRGLPRNLTTICLKCLEKSPRRRYVSALELAKDLHRFQAGEPIEARPAGSLEKVYRWCRRRPLVAALLSLSAALAITFVITVVAYDARLKDALAGAELKKEQERQQIVRLNVMLGLLELEDEDSFAALLRFTEALRWDEGGAEERHHRMRIATCLRQSPRLVGLFVPGKRILCAGRCPSGCKVAAATADHVVEVWDVATGRSEGPGLRHEAAPVAGVFSPDGQSLATVDPKGITRLWDLKTDKSRTLPAKSSGVVDQVVFAAGGRFLLTRRGEEDLQLWDAKTVQPVSLPELSSQQARYVCCSEDGAWLFTLDAGGEGKFWDLVKGKTIGQLPKPMLGVSRAALSTDGSRLAVVGPERTLRIWDVSLARWLGRPIRLRLGVSRVLFSPDGQQILTAGSDPTAQVWQAETGDWIADLARHEGGVTHAGFSPDGRLVVTGDPGSGARVWDAATGRPRTPPLRHGGSLHWAAFVDGGKQLVVVGKSSAVAVWDLRQGQDAGAGKPDEELSPGGPRVVTLGNGIVVRAKQARASGPLFPPRPGEPLVEHGVFSPDGTRVIVRDDNGTARVWDTATGQPITPPLRHGSPVHYAAFSADGAELLTAGEDRTARVWEADGGESLRPPLKLPHAIQRLFFRSGGNEAIVVCAGGAVTTWDLTPDNRPVGELLRLAQILACGRIEEFQEQKGLEADALRSAWQELQGKR